MTICNYIWLYVTTYIAAYVWHQFISCVTRINCYDKQNYLFLYLSFSITTLSLSLSPLYLFLYHHSISFSLCHPLSLCSFTSLFSALSFYICLSVSRALSLSDLSLISLWSLSDLVDTITRFIIHPSVAISPCYISFPSPLWSVSPSVYMVTETEWSNGQCAGLLYHWCCSSRVRIPYNQSFGLLNA